MNLCPGYVGILWNMYLRKAGKYLKNEIIMRPIGYIETPFKSREGIGRQADNDLMGTLHIYEEYREGIADIKPGTYGVVLFNFDRSEGYKLTTMSMGRNEIMGVFSTRSPYRPNGIGMSIVEYLSNDGEKIEFRGVDMLDGTPILDLKPYTGEILPSKAANID